MTREEASKLVPGDRVKRISGGSEMWPEGSIDVVSRVSIWRDGDVFIYIERGEGLNLLHTRLEKVDSGGDNYLIF